MSKRPSIDLLELTSAAATPMPEAVQRAATPASAPAPSTATELKAPGTPAAKTSTQEDKAAGRVAAVKTANLEALAFKVPPAFRKRFRQRAVAADLKLNELLFAALDAWEEQQGLKR